MVLETIIDNMDDEILSIKFLYANNSIFRIIVLRYTVAEREGLNPR